MSPACGHMASPPYKNQTVVATKENTDKATRTVHPDYGQKTGPTCYFLTLSSEFPKHGIMCGPFQSCQNILRLLEIIFSALSFIIVIFRGIMVSPWGVWCEFVWLFCIIVPLALLVIEAKKWNILLAAFLPNWDDLTCGLTILCAVMITSATVIFVALFVCSYCVASILCFISSLIATVVFLVDAVKQKMKCPSGYMSSLRGILRTAQAFVACIIITAALDYFVINEWSQNVRPIGMIMSVIVFFVCLLVTVCIIVLNLIKLLQCLLSFGLSMMEFVFDILAVLLYLLAIILWAVFGYTQYNTYIRDKYSYNDLNTVTIGAIINLVLYTVDLVLAFKSR